MEVEPTEKGDVVNVSWPPFSDCVPRTVEPSLKVTFPVGVPLGVALGAFVYGCYGLLVGTVFRRELETIFAILVLINIDAGWLQNPIYYRTAESQWLIRALPAHLPAQTAYVAAFAGDSIGGLALGGLSYGAGLLLLALALYAVRMRVRR